MFLMDLAAFPVMDGKQCTGGSPCDMRGFLSFFTLWLLNQKPRSGKDTKPRRKKTEVFNMDLPWGDPRSIQFITNVGLITSDGPNGPDIMSSEWTHHISYNPGLIAVCIRPGGATHENIRSSKEF